MVKLKKKIIYLAFAFLLLPNIVFAEDYTPIFSKCDNQFSCFVEGLNYPNMERVYSQVYLKYIYLKTQKSYSLFSLQPNPAASVQYFCHPSGVSPSSVPCSWNAYTDAWDGAWPGWNEKWGINGAHALYTGTDQGCGWYGLWPECYPKYAPAGVQCCLPVKITKPSENSIATCTATLTLSGGQCPRGNCYPGCGLNGGCPISSPNSWSGTVNGKVEGDFCVFTPKIDYDFGCCFGEIYNHPMVGGSIDFSYCSSNLQCSEWTACFNDKKTRTCNDGCGSITTEELPCTVCAQVITYAKNSATGECKEYPTSCVPDGWTVVTKCATTPPTPKPRKDFFVDPIGAVLEFLVFLFTFGWL